MFLQNLLRRFPTVEGRPVVGSDNQVEIPVGILTGQLVERMDGIRRPGQVELEVGGLEAWISFYRSLYQWQEELVFQQVLMDLEGIQR